jgi:hypothetical protein
LFETTVVETSDSYSFNVENKGERPINAVMMFAKNPDDSEKFNDPDSPLSKTLIPLAVSGLLLFLGTAVIIIGLVILIIDYRKKQSGLD